MHIFVGVNLTKTNVLAVIILSFMELSNLTNIKEALADAKARHELAFVLGNGINRYLSDNAIFI